MISTRSTLILHPLHPTTTDIVKRFAQRKSLTSEQLNFLHWHSAQLSDSNFDPILRYYLSSHRKSKKHSNTSFLLPHEEMNREAIALLKKRLNLMLQGRSEQPVAIQMTQKQFLQFRQYTIQDLIFWHGNQFLTGAPFYPGGIPPLILFQWGNLFGIIKYGVIGGEKAMMGNLLLYFEEMQERTLEQCVKDYQKRRMEKTQLQNSPENDKKIIHRAEEKLIHPPHLTKSKSYLDNQLLALKPQ
ncbi:MAG: hypothetical protein K0S27_1741 [Gammaproteobacteria bacterium]|jgi:hypothetical protein|nr:hypothetical protein [Gammaproteobacteria bacterium]